jgi:hypothetical protein
VDRRRLVDGNLLIFDETPLPEFLLVLLLLLALVLGDVGGVEPPVVHRVVVLCLPDYWI